MIIQLEAPLVSRCGYPPQSADAVCAGQYPEVRGGGRVSRGRSHWGGGHLRSGEIGEACSLTRHLHLEYYNQVTERVHHLAAGLQCHLGLGQGELILLPNIA